MITLVSMRRDLANVSTRLVNQHYLHKLREFARFSRARAGSDARWDTGVKISHAGARILHFSGATCLCLTLTSIQKHQTPTAPAVGACPSAIGKSVLPLRMSCEIATPAHVNRTFAATTRTCTRTRECEDLRAVRVAYLKTCHIILCKYVLIKCASFTAIQWYFQMCLSKFASPVVQ
jgi:hypothetical protein